MLAFRAVAAAPWGGLLHLGGVGLAVAALVTNSVLPIPAGVEALTAILAASHPRLWWYYALMATTGSVAGGYLSYGVGQKGGEAALERKAPRSEVQRVRRIFERFGFWSILGPAIIPVFPTLPFVIGAGVMKYPRRRAMLALAAGRLLRDGGVVLLAAVYGRRVLGMLAEYHGPAVVVLIAGALGAAVMVTAYVVKRKRFRRREAQNGRRAA